MERLTKKYRNDSGTAISKEPLINRETNGINDYCSRIITKLADYEDLEDNSLLLRLPCKDKLINALAEKVLNSEFGRCYMCTNSMKNITLDGVNNGCDGNCSHEEFTTDDLIEKVVEEISYKSECEQKLKEMDGDHGITE